MNPELEMHTLRDLCGNQAASNYNGDWKKLLYSSVGSDTMLNYCFIDLQEMSAIELYYYVV